MGASHAQARASSLQEAEERAPMTWYDGDWYRVPDAAPYPSTGVLLAMALVVLVLVLMWRKR